VIALLAVVAAHAATCPPSVELCGDGELVSRLLPVLMARGLAPARDACGVVTVNVASAGAGYRIEARDPGGRVQVRALHDLGNAPSVIEGLVRSGVAVGAMAPPAPASLDRPHELAVLTYAEASVDSRGTPAAGLHAEVAGAGGLYRPFLLGRWAFAPEVQGGLASRHEVELLAGLRRPFALAGLELAPGAAIGAGWSRVARSRPRCSPICGTAVVPDHAVADALAPRLSASLLLSRSVGPTLRLSALVDASFAPFSGGARTPDWAASLPEREAAQVALAGDPPATLRLALGAAWSWR
jgi:hypothetical protein